MGIHETKTFKSGNSVALRLPRGLGFAENERFSVQRDGDILTARRIPTEEEQAERLQRFRTAIEAMRALPKPATIQERDPFEFPDRPGL